ncbi:MAG: ParB/RepB/Spo0J family partition protein, partial [Clostridia bacterium]
MLQRLRKRIFSDNAIISQLNVHDIHPNPAQPRKVFCVDELRELSASIRENGVLQPITVRRFGGGYTLVAGERRLRATIMAGFSEIPAIISDMDEKQSSLIALVENLQRCDLGFFEEATGIHNLIRNYGFSQEEAAKKLGKSQSAVSNKLRLLRLPPSIVELILSNGLSERHARALLRLTTPDGQESALGYIIKNNLN